MEAKPPVGTASGILTRCGLTAEQLRALRRQGFVATERRGASRKKIHKLRFRWQGRQQVRYLGTDPGAAAQVRAALERWQSEARRRREAQRAARQARQAAKRQLTPLLPERGLRSTDWRSAARGQRNLMKSRITTIDAWIAVTVSMPSTTLGSTKTMNHTADDGRRLAGMASTGDFADAHGDARPGPDALTDLDAGLDAGDVPPHLADRRTARIAEYLAQILEYADPLRANVGAVNADLLFMADRLRQRLEVAPWETLEDFEDLKPAIDSLLRIHKQIDRFAQFEARLGRDLGVAPRQADGSTAGPVRQATLGPTARDEIAN
jgi:hypothetical protein